MKRYQYWFAKMGSREKRRHSLDMLLGPSELPGSDWRTLGEVAWRMGMQNSGLGDISRRARKSGEFMALRRYRQEVPPRGLFLQVGPYPSAEDASQAWAALGTSDAGRWPGVTRLSERMVTDIAVPGIDDLHAWEYHTRRGELVGFQRFIGGRIDRVAFVVSGTSAEPGWEWDDLVSVCSAQARKISAFLKS